MNELQEIGAIVWLATTSVTVLVAWGRIEVKLAQMGKSIDQLWEEFDSLHPRRANPGHRVGIRHIHNEDTDA